MGTREKRPHGSESETSTMDSAFAEIVKAVESTWGSGEAWNRVETWAASHNRPSEVAAFFERALDIAHPKDIFEMIARRATAFFDEWFGDDPDAINDILLKIIARDATATWAFERLTAFMTVRERWDDLFAAYDRLLSSELSVERRKSLLEEASDIAKDIADNPEKALAYLRALHGLDRENFQRFRVIERMLVRQEAWSDLIAIWEGQMPLMEGDESKKTWIQIATCHLARLGQAEKSFNVLKAYLEKHPGDSEGCAELDALLKHAHTPLALRLKALDLLLDNYDSAGRKPDAITAIEAAIALADPDTRPSLHRRAASRLAILSRDEAAIAHVAALLLLSPGDADAVKNLRLLAVRAKRPDLRAAALANAAKAAEEDALKVAHLLDAARVYADDLNALDEAVSLLSSILDIPEIDPAVALSVSHKLNALYAAQGRKTERLGVLEQIAILEKTQVLRRTVLVEAAGLAEELGDTGRALSLWRALLAMIPDDLEAISAVIDLLEQSGDFDGLIEALSRRAEILQIPEQRRMDLIRVAEVARVSLNDTARAIDLWWAIFEEFGSRTDAVEALDILLTTTGRFAELDAVLERSVTGDFDRIVDLFLRRAEINFGALENPEGAFLLYRQVLVIDPASKRAIEGMGALISHPLLAARAVDALVIAHRITDDWRLLLDLTPKRLETAANEAAQIPIYVEAAELENTRAANPEAARDLLTRALPLDPENQKIEAEAMRLARAHGGWNRTGLALGHAASALFENPKRRAHLKFLEGQVLERELNKDAGALAAYLETAKIEKRDPEVWGAVARVATRLADWDAAGKAVVYLIVLEDKLNFERLQQLEAEARERAALTELPAALEQAVQRQMQLRAGLRREMESYIAAWYRDACDDLASAERAAARALAADERHLGSLLLLADIERRRKSKKLVSTLASIYKLKDDDLDPLMEAALTVLDQVDEHSEKRRHLVQLHEAASNMWRLGKRTAGTHTVEESCHFATWQMVALDEARGMRERAAELLLFSAALPFDAVRSREMRRKAAALYEADGKNASAIAVHMTLWQQDGDDIETLVNLERLLEINHRFSELLGVKLKLLANTEDQERKMALRLDIAQLAAVLEGGEARIDMLKANLADEPGHILSMQRLSDLMTARRMFEPLAEMLEEQSKRLSERAANERAAALILQAAKLFEENLHDVSRAISAYERVVDLSAAPTAMDALARLYSAENNLAHAISWLKRRLDIAKPHERVSVLLRLARAQLRTDQRHDAVATLEQAFDEVPRNPEVRGLLLDQYRALESYDALAEALSRAAAHLSNPAVVLAYSKEAAEIYFNKLHVIGRAVSVLERAVALAPEEQKFKVMLAEALVADAQHDRAEVILNELIAGFGRRRSKERGAIHMQLALLAKARGDLDASMAQLELAITMDTHNVAALKMLAELAREKGDGERAERVYRSLLLMVRRESPSEGEAQSITPSEILFELSFLSAEREQNEKAKEMEESAFEAITSDAAVVDRLATRLTDKGAFPLLARVYGHLLSCIDSPRLSAKVRSHLADLLAGPLGRPDEALEMRLKAVAEDPGSPEMHDAALALAEEQGCYDAYVALIERLVAESRRDGDDLRRCELLLRLAGIHAAKGAVSIAWQMFDQAEALRVREVDVLKLGVKLARAEGDEPRVVRLLSKLSSLGEEDVGAETRADAMYSLAEIYLAADETFDEGIALFERAFREGRKCARAGHILMKACRRGKPDIRLMRIFEGVAHQTEDMMLRLEYLELKSVMPETRATEMREGAELALRLKAYERAEALMRRMIEVREVASEDKAAVSWAILTLAERRKSAGDLEGALLWLNEASEIATPPEIFDIGLEIGALARASIEGIPLAIKVYKWLLEFDPSQKRAWEPLAELYTAQNDVEGFEALVQESLYTIEDPTSRNALRLLWAKLILSTEHRKEEAVEVLKNIQLDEPDNAESLGLLAYCLKAADREDEYKEYLEYRFETARGGKNGKELKTLALALGPELEESDADRVVTVYREALAQLPGDRELLTRLAAKLTGEEHAAERVHLKEQMLFSEPDQVMADFALNIAAEYRNIGDEPSALRVLKFAYQRNSSHDAIQAALVETFRARGDYRGLVEMLQKQAEMMSAPEARARAFREIARVARDELNDSPQEITALQAAIEVCPDEIELRLRLLEALGEAKRYEEAIEHVTTALKQFDSKEGRASLLNYRGDLLRSSGNLNDGLSDLKEAFALSPGRAAENLEKALVALRDENRREGDVTAERSTVLQLAKVLEYTQKQADLRVLLSQWLEINPDDIDIWKRLLGLVGEMENWDEVAVVSEKLIHLTEGEDQLKAALRLSMACAVSNQLDVAERGLEFVFALHPDNEEIKNELKSLYEKIGAKTKLAGMLLEDSEFVKEPSKRSGLLKRAGLYYLEAGETEAALTTLQGSLSLNPEDTALCLTLIDTFLDRGELDSANDLTDKAIKDQGGRRSKELGLLQFRKALIMGAYGDTSQELSWLEQAFLTNRNDGAIAIQLANLAEEMEEWDLAEKALKQIVLLKEVLPISRSDALLRQAKIAFRHEDDKKRATLYARKALQEDPNHEETKRFLSEIGEE